MTTMTKHEHPLSWVALFRVATTAGIIWLCWYLFDTILLIIVSLMLAAALFPIVYKLMQRKIPITLASVLVVLVLFIPIILIIVTIVPGLIQQFPEIVTQLNLVVNKAAILPPEVRNSNFSQYAQNAGSYLLQSTSKITSSLAKFFTVIFLTLYFLIDSKRLHEIVLSLIPEENQEKANKLSDEVTRINGQYIRGNLLISAICGVSIFIGLSFMGVPYAGALALFAALTDLLPQIGAFIGATPAIIIAFAMSPTTGVLTLLLFVVYQQIENNILAPNVYNKALDLSPALSFIAVLIGGSLAGIIGAFIALPIAASIPTIVRYIHSEEK
jgi:predicted PurR-regulated permease PerM